MPKDCLIVVAHQDELNDSFKKLPNLLVTGVGKVNAAYHLTKKLAELRNAGSLPKHVINMGSAGSKKFPKGALVAPHRFVQRDMDCVAFGYDKGVTPGDKSRVLEHEKVIHDLPSAVCGTGDSFVTTENVDPDIDVVDMEAYALARVCAVEGISFIAIKYITDGLDEGGGDDWKGEVKGSADVMFEYLEKMA